METAAILKIEKLQYLQNRLADFDENCFWTAVCPILKKKIHGGVDLAVLSLIHPN